ncbi:hypothetical protein ABKN59_009953 [Abortiporus biennis]
MKMKAGQVVSRIRNRLSPFSDNSVASTSNSRPPKVSPCYINRLPPELLYEILQWLISPPQVDLLSFKYDTPIKYHFIDTSNLVLGQIDVAQTTLVCRFWNEISMEILYAHPCLISAHQIRLLRRTFEKLPTLSHLMRGLYVADFEENKGYVYVPYRRREKSFESRKLDIVSLVLQDQQHGGNGSFIESLTIGSSPVQEPILTSYQVLSTALTSHPHTRIRHLTINGPFPDDSFQKLQLPNLETICLCSGAQISARTRFPFLPKLHSIRLAKVVCWVDPCETFAMTQNTVTDGSQTLPNLRSLECYRCEYLLSAMESLHLLPNLDTLFLIGESELMIFYRLVRMDGALGHIKNLAFGLVDTLYYPLDLSEWKFGKSLESLRIFGKVIGNASVSTLLHCLQNNLLSPGGDDDEGIDIKVGNRLKKLMYYSGVYQFGDERLDELKSFGRQYGVKVDFYQHDVNYWVNGRLSLT